MIAGAIYSKLSNNAELSALVSDRIYPVLAPQGVASPFLVFEKTGGEIESTLSADTNINRDNLQITCFSETYQEAFDISAIVAELLSRWQGVESGVTIEDVFFENESDFFDAQTEFFQFVLDFEIIYRGS